MRYILLLLPFFVFFTSKIDLQKSEKTQLAVTDLQDEGSSKKPFELYPNPVINQFTLKSSYFSDAQLELFIFDVSGKLVVKIDKLFLDDDQSCRVDISQLSSGLYFIQLRSGNYSATKKIYKT